MNIMDDYRRGGSFDSESKQAVASYPAPVVFAPFFNHFVEFIHSRTDLRTLDYIEDNGLLNDYNIYVCSVVTVKSVEVNELVKFYSMSRELTLWVVGDSVSVCLFVRGRWLDDVYQSLTTVFSIKKETSDPDCIEYLEMAIIDKGGYGHSKSE